MVPERHAHLLQPLNKLKNICKVIGSKSLKVRDVKSACLELKKMLTQPVFVQLVELIKAQNRDSEDKQQRLEVLVLRNFDEITQELKDEGEAPDELIGDPLRITEIRMLSLVQQIEKREEKIPVIFSRYAALQNPLRRLLGKGLSGFQALLIGDTKAHEVLRTPFFQAWEQEKIACEERYNILKSIDNLANFDNEVRNREKITNLRIDLQKVCDYLIEKITSSLALTALEIKSISFKFTEKKGKQKAKLKLFINEKHRTFTGETASLLKELLENPNEEFDIDEFDAKKPAEQLDTIGDRKVSNKIRQITEEINNQIARSEEFREFGIEHFIEFKKNLVRINPLYANLI